MRLLYAAAIALSLGLFVACADDKTPAAPAKPVDDKARAEKLAALQKKFDTEIAGLKAKFEKAEPAEQRGIVAEMRETVALCADKALAIAEENPKDETGFAAAKFLLDSASRYGATDLKEVKKAIDLVAENHVTNPKVKDLLLPAMRLGKNGERLLKAVGEEGTDKEAKAVALFLQGYQIAQRVDEEEDEKALASLVAKASEMIEKAVKEAPDAKVGRTTIGAEAKKMLADLKSVSLVSIDKPVPDVEGTNLDGKGVKLSSYKGKVVLLDVWATWCGPCKAMIPHERELVEKLKGKPFVLLSVSCDDEQKTLTDFLEKEPMPWDHWFDGRGGKVAKTFRIRAFPTMYLIDHAGVVRQKWVGNPGNDKLDKAVEDLVKEAEKAKG